MPISRLASAALPFAPPSPKKALAARPQPNNELLEGEASLPKAKQTWGSLWVEDTPSGVALQENNKSRILGGSGKWLNSLQSVSSVI